MTRRTSAPGAVMELETLEPRALLSAYLYNSLIDTFHLDRAIQDLRAPTSGVVGFGAAVVGIGDINGDGYGDFAISSTGAPPQAGSVLAGQQGNVFVYSGHDASLIRTLNDGAWEFGAALANLGDVNDDGVPDLLVGSPRYDGNGNAVVDPTGRAYVYSGADGAVLRTFEGATLFGDFGRAVSRLNDANGDGVADLLVAAPGTDATLNGQVFIFSGANGSPLQTFTGESPGDRFGAAIAAAPDDPHDHDLFAIGAPFNDTSGPDAGRVYVYRLDGTQAYAPLNGHDAGDEFGSAMVVSLTVHDNRIGPEHTVIIGAPGSDFGVNPTDPVLTDRGHAELFSLTDGLFRAVGAPTDPVQGARFGARIATAGDIDNNRLNAIVISAPGVNRAYAFDASLHALNGPGFGSSTTADPLSPTILGFNAAGAGDANNDGILDIISSDGAGRVTIVSGLAASPPIRLDGASKDLRFMWTQQGGLRFFSAQPYGLSLLFIDGVPRTYSRVPGLVMAGAADPHSPTSIIGGVGPDGTIVFRNIVRDGSSPSTELLVALPSGQVVTLRSLVQTFEGQMPANFADLNVTEYGAGGDLLLVDGTAQNWVLSGGVLTHLSFGGASDVNASGAVVGRNASEQTVLWTRASGITVIPELDALSFRINDNGTIVGTRTGTRSQGDPGIISLWSNGVVTDVQGIRPIDHFLVSAAWYFRALDNTDRVLADLQTSFERPITPSYSPTYIVDEDGLRPLIEATHRVLSTTFGYADNNNTAYTGPMRLLPDGRILAYSAILTPLQQRELGVLREGSPTPTVTIPGQGRYIAAVNQFNELVLFQYQGSSWTIRRLTQAPVAAGNTNLAVFEDPRDGRAYVAYGDGHFLSIFIATPLQGEPSTGAGLSGFSGRNPIVRDLTAFTNSVGVVVLAGFDPSDHLVLFYRNGEPSAAGWAGWAFDDLSQNHLIPQGLATPHIVSGLTTFSTFWNGMNIAGLDSQGHIQTFWWAPGMMLWRVDDLAATALPLIPVFTGEISAFVTPWNTLHINGVDSFGHVSSLWWAPGFGTRWSYAALDPQGPVLAADSITSFTTPWGGLSVAGRDASTRIADVYWWSPASNQWTAEPLLGSSPALNPVLTGRFSSFVGPDDSAGRPIAQNIYGRAEDGSLYRFSWRPGDGPWTVENLTDLLG